MIKKIKEDNIELNKFLTKNMIDIPIKSPFSKSVVYIVNNLIVGYLNYSIMYEKAEINNIYVLENYRSNGIGSKLLDYLLKECESCENITLEVKKNNENALRLYKKYGFKEVAIREKYYNGVDGILMVLEVK